MELSFVIPHREEGDWLQWTIDGILADYPASEIIAIEDKPAIGLSYQRHKGILKATNEIIICADAHIKLGPGFKAGVLDWFSDPEHEKDIACFQTRSIEPGTKRITGCPRFGANLKEIDMKRPFVSQWQYVDTHGLQVANVLGGVYAFRRSWYLDGLFGIWRFHRAWGKSEQMISLTNYLCGGRNVCLGDIWCAHYFKRHMKLRPFPLAIPLIRQNWMVIAWGLIDDENRDRIFKILYLGNTSSDYGRKLLDRTGVIFDIQSFINTNAVNDYSSYRDNFLITS